MVPLKLNKFSEGLYRFTIQFFRIIKPICMNFIKAHMEIKLLKFGTLSYPMMHLHMSCYLSCVLAKY